MPPEKNPGAEALPIGEEKADEDVAALKTEDQNEYDLEEQMQDADKQLNNKPDNLGIGRSSLRPPRCRWGSCWERVIRCQLLLLLCSSV